MYATTWETYRNEPWLAVNVHQEQTASYNGWHDLVLQVAGGERQVLHRRRPLRPARRHLLPRDAAVDQLQPLVHRAADSSAARPRAAYNQQVDWFYFSKNEVVAPAEVVNRVNGYRTTATTWKDTVPNP